MPELSVPALNWELRLWGLTLVQPRRKAAVLLTDKAALYDLGRDP